MMGFVSRHLIAFVIRLPYIDGIVDREVRKELVSIERKMHGDGDPQALVKLPAQAMSCSQIWKQIQDLQAAEASVYAPGPVRLFKN